jgi:hypothetical protein
MPLTLSPFPPGLIRVLARLQHPAPPIFKPNSFRDVVKSKGLFLSNSLATKLAS